MSSLPPPIKVLFYKPTSEIARFTILTPIHHWYAHYDHVKRVPFRCGGAICAFCDTGREPELRFVLGCASSRTGRCTIELRERHRKVLEAIEAQPEGVIGTVIDVYKSGTALNSPVEVDIRNHKVAEEWDIRLLVESLGMAPTNP